jgi:phospholipase C
MRNIRDRKLTASIALGAMLLTQTMWPIVAAGAAPVAKTPIQHVIIIVGENRTFDHLFGTYVPPNLRPSIRHLCTTERPDCPKSAFGGDRAMEWPTWYQRSRR